MITILLYSVDIKIPETVVISRNEYSVFWRADSIICYMIGACIGIHFFDWFALRKNKIASVICVGLFIGCGLCLTIAKRIGMQIDGLAYVLIMTVFCFSTWFMFDVFAFSKNPKAICEFSFMMFALNFYLGFYLSKIMFILLPKT